VACLHVPRACVFFPFFLLFASWRMLLFLVSILFNILTALTPR
jgi:hypothetical protein